MIRLPLGVLVLALAAPAVAQTAPPIAVDTLRSVTKELSSDAYEGRAPTTPGEDKTVAYLIERFRAAGLKPGNAGKWTQDVPMVELTTSNVSPIAITGGKTPLSLAYRTDAVFATLSGQAAHRAQGFRIGLRRLRHQRA